MKELAIGRSDFRDIRQRDLFLVDKTLLIRDVIDSGSAVTVLPHPRRFGKTVGYNPWSIVNSLKSPRGTRKSYWLNTASNALVPAELAAVALRQIEERCYEAQLRDAGCRDIRKLAIVVQGKCVTVKSLANSRSPCS